MKLRKFVAPVVAGLCLLASPITAMANTTYIPTHSYQVSSTVPEWSNSATDFTTPGTPFYLYFTGRGVHAGQQANLDWLFYNFNNALSYGYPQVGDVSSYEKVMFPDPAGYYQLTIANEGYMYTTGGTFYVTDWSDPSIPYA